MQCVECGCPLSHNLPTIADFEKATELLSHVKEQNIDISSDCADDRLRRFLRRKDVFSTTKPLTNDLNISQLDNLLYVQDQGPTRDLC